MSPKEEAFLRSPGARLQGAASTLALVIVAGLIPGCVTSRGELKLEIPRSAQADRANGMTAVIATVRDRRVFEDKPSKPSIPSLGSGGAVDQVPEAIKQRAIARKRSNWGKAYGDILLEQGQTVESVARDIVAAALSSCGYTVRDRSSGAGKESMRVDVTLDKFWGWFNPGVGRTYLNTWTSMQIAVTRDGRTQRIPIDLRFNMNVIGMAAGRHWKMAFEGLLRDALAEVRVKLCGSMRYR